MVAFAWWQVMAALAPMPEGEYEAAMAAQDAALSASSPTSCPASLRTADQVNAAGAAPEAANLHMRPITHWNMREARKISWALHTRRRCPDTSWSPPVHESVCGLPTERINDLDYA